MRLKFSKSQIRIRPVAEFLLIRGVFLLFRISHDRAVFWSCSPKCLRSTASPVFIHNLAVCYPLYYMQNWVFLCLMLLLLHRIGIFLAYVAALLVASFSGF